MISYGAAIWGSKSFSCINAVQNRAMIFFLGVGKYTQLFQVTWAGTPRSLNSGIVLVITGAE